MPQPKLVVAGSGGPIARHVVAAAREDFDVVALTRTVDGSQPAGSRAVAWNPRAVREGDEAAIDALAATLEGARAVVNLAGAGIANGRLGPDHRRRVMESRVDSTTTLVGALARTSRPPDAWIQGSASGYYGDRGEEVLTEDAARGSALFLSDVVAAWENAAQPASARTRLVVTRFGLVLAEDAPAWQRMLLPIRLFVGGPLGGGTQWFPWIDGDELGNVVRFLIDRDDARGVFNVTAPEPVRQRQLARKAATRLGRPAIVPVPAFALRIVLGGVADQLLLPSQRVVPERLDALGYAFEYPDIDRALDKLLGS